MIGQFRGEYRWLSNFWPAKVTLDGVVYPTVEHAFQAAKTLDEKQRAQIRNAPTPGQAKRLGRSVTLRADWEQTKLATMTYLTQEKYKDSELRQRLNATGRQYLQEGNEWNDTYWGICRGIGENHLGRIIMEVREDVLDDTVEHEDDLPF